jgi:uncharacterized protein YecT (DUF1311 family)
MMEGFGMQTRSLGLVVLSAALLGLAGTATARARHDNGGGGLPNLDVKGSCSDAQKFSSGDDKTNSAYKGCMQDEMNAKTDLAKRWSSFNSKDRRDCVEQARMPSPSYVEVLTCLEMGTDAIRNAPKIDGRPVPQIGGPVAPGLNAPPPPPPGSAPTAPGPRT